jgi:hypothetical protein
MQHSACQHDSAVLMQRLSRAIGIAAAAGDGSLSGEKGHHTLALLAARERLFSLLLLNSYSSSEHFSGGWQRLPANKLYPCASCPD